MHDKITTTVYVSAKVLKQAKSLGIPISESLEKVLTIMISQYGGSEEEVELAAIAALKDRWENELHTYESQIMPFRARVKSITERYEKQKALVEEIHRSERVATLMQRLNEGIKKVGYDLLRVKETCQEEIGELSQFIPITDEWLTKHIARLQSIDVL